MNSQQAIKLQHAAAAENAMTTQQAITIAAAYLRQLKGHTFDVLTVSKPVSPDAALNLAKVISKLSPLLGNLIEFNTVEFLNKQPEFEKVGTWVRQDPGFPDTIFQGGILPIPGLEIKAWFPLATEITARFKDSQSHFLQDNTHVAMLAWLPEKLIFGKPQILAVCVVSGKSVAEARDTHYHNPPDYLVLEPEDCTARTRNLQQTNTNGYKWQGSPEQFAKATELVASWGKDGKKYLPTAEYQLKLRQLFGQYNYRLDTNFAKMDRIVHTTIENFKSEVSNLNIHGLTVKQWSRLFASENDTAIREALRTRLNIIEAETDSLVH